MGLRRFSKGSGRSGLLRPLVGELWASAELDCDPVCGGGRAAVQAGCPQDLCKCGNASAGFEDAGRWWYCQPYFEQVSLLKGVGFGAEIESAGSDV